MGARGVYGANTGGSVSTTVTVKVALDELPNGSDAVQVTVVVHGDAAGPPAAGGQASGNVVLGGGEHVTLTPGGPAPQPPSAVAPSVWLQLSIAVGGMKNTVAPAELVAWAVMLLGIPFTG
jgi:hypothetical protein